MSGPGRLSPAYPSTQAASYPYARVDPGLEMGHGFLSEPNRSWWEANTEAGVGFGGWISGVAFTLQAKTMVSSESLSTC